MPVFDPKNKESSSRIIKQLRDKVDLEIKGLKDLQAGSTTQWYGQVDEHLKTGIYVK
jgi:hypothetical protein